MTLNHAIVQSEAMRASTLKFSMLLKQAHPEKYTVKIKHPPKKIVFHEDFLFANSLNAAMGFSWGLIASVIPISKSPELSIEKIIKEVSERRGVSPAEIKGNRRSTHILHARYEAIDRCRSELGWSLPRIGRSFGNRDHTTILHAINRVQILKQRGEWPPV